MMPGLRPSIPKPPSPGPCSKSSELVCPQAWPLSGPSDGILEPKLSPNSHGVSTSPARGTTSGHSRRSTRRKSAAEEKLEQRAELAVAYHGSGGVRTPASEQSATSPTAPA